MSRTISDIAKEIGSGLTPLRSNPLFWDSDDIPWLKTEQLGNHEIYNTNEYISRRAIEETSIKLWPPHTITIAMYGEGKTRGKASIIMSEMTTNQACCNVVVDEAKADYRFLYYWLTYNYEQIRSLASGVRKNLNSDDIKGFSFPEFDVEAQHQIAQVLSSIDKKIDNNTGICFELESMAKLLYDYWFVQFDFPDENGKPYKSSGGKMVWNEQLKREIPEGWAKKEVSAIANIVANSVTPRPDIEYRHYSIPAFDEKGMPVEESGASINSNKYLVPENAILVSKLNPQFKRIWVISDSNERSICSTEFIPFVSIEGHREYLYSLLNSDAFHTYMVQCSSSSTGSRTRIDPELCLRFTFASPKDNALIKRYCKTVAPMLAKIEELKDENQHLTSLRDFLLPLLMNGQVKIKETGIILPEM